VQLVRNSLDEQTRIGVELAHPMMPPRTVRATVRATRRNPGNLFMATSVKNGKAPLVPRAFCREILRDGPRQREAPGRDVAAVSAPWDR
jgi:hypothetical protein